MKKIKLFLLLALLAAPFLQSCNSKVDQPQMYALVTIQTLGLNQFYGLTDDNEKIWVGDGTMVANYKPKDGQRAFIYFTPLEEKVQGYTYNAKVYAIDDILTKPVVLVDNKAQNDTLGTDGITIVDARISGEYLNVEFAVITNGITNHVINLIENQVEPVEGKDGYISLELRHKGNGSEQGSLVKGFICFRLSPEYNPTEMGKKGLYIRKKPITQYEDKEYVTIDLPKKDNE